MTYRQEMGRLARELVRLLNDGGTVPADDIRAALAGHSAVVSLLRAVHADLVVTEWRGVSELSHALARQPRINDQPLTSVVQSEPSSPAGARWRNVAKAATIAQEEWHHSTLASRPVGDSAWSEIADIAAMTEAIGLLNGDIADSLNAAARWRDAGDFRTSQAGLLSIAQEVRRLASTGTLPTAPDLMSNAADSIVLVHSPTDLPPALTRLSALVSAANNLPPTQVELISLIVAETATNAAAALGRPGAPAPAALLSHAKLLNGVSGYSSAVAPLRLGNGKAATQAKQIHQHLRDLKQRGLPLPPAVAREAGGLLAGVTRALTESADRQVKRGLWLLSREGNGPLRWTASLGSVDEPRILTRLRAANDHGVTLTRSVGPARQGNQALRRASPIPRKLLAPALSQRGSPVPIVNHAATNHRRR